ncbi:MAG: CPBP family intramembrane metalloprotease [Oscillospiraceae bacterium]|nr:CPBP family intramembrane metalloprotease [Oscillospiraceae bacterium]
MHSEQVYRAEAASDLREDVFKIALSLCTYLPVSSVVATIFLSAYSSTTSITDPDLIAQSFSQSPYYSVYLLAVTVIPLCICILLLSKLTKRKLSIISAKPTVNKNRFFKFLLLGLGAIPLCAAANIVSNSILARFNLQPSATAAPNGALATVIFVLSHAVLAPILEETLFRFLILERLRRYGDVFAVLVSAFLFMLLHSSFFSFAYAFVAGIIFGFLAVFTGSLLCPLILHALNNLISVAMILLEGRLTSEQIDLIYIGLLAVMAVISVCALLLLQKSNDGAFRLTFDGKLIFKGRKAAIIFTSLPMIFFIIMTVAFAVSAV